MEVIMHWLGLDNASGAVYLFWSGFFGDITIFAALITYYIHTRCHVSGCNKRAKYQFKHYKLCKVHHPAVPKDVSHEHIKKLHGN